jgi:3'-5' exoribonuclease
MFPEALVLHYMDDLDSKMEAMRAHFQREAELDSPWSSYNPSLGRPLLNSAKFLAPKVVPAAEDTSPTESEMERSVELREEAPTLPGFKS